MTVTAFLFIIVLFIFLYITYEPRKDLAIPPDTVFPGTVRRVQCLYLDGGWVVSAWSTVFVERDSEALYHSSKGKKVRWVNIWAKQNAVQDDRGVLAVISASGNPLCGETVRN